MYYKNIYFFILLLCLLAFTFPSYAQNEEVVDSLRSQLNQGNQDQAVLLALALEFYGVDNNVALNYARDAYKLAHLKGDSLILVKSQRIAGQLLRNLDDVEQSIIVLKQTLNSAERNGFEDERKKILNGLALSYTFVANYDEALNYNFKSLEVREKGGDKAEISIALNNIGLVYFKLSNYEKAIEFYEKSLAMKRDVGDKFDVDRLLINIGLCYNGLGDFDVARKYFNDGFKLCGNDCADVMQIEGYYGIGISYLQEFDKSKVNSLLENAAIFFLRSYEISIRVANKRFQLENLLGLAHINIMLNEVEEAKKRLGMAEEIAAETEYNQLFINIYKEYSNLYNQIDDFKNAAKYQGKYIRLKDSIYSEKLIDNLAKIQTNYAERQNIQTIANKEETIQRQRSLNIAIVTIAVLATMLVFVLVRSNRVKRRVNAALSEAKAIIEDQNRQLLNSNIHLNEELEERNIDLEKANESLQKVNDELDNFIYKTSHDIRGPLASLKGMCNVALIDVQDPVALDYLHKLDITADKLNTILTRLLIVNQLSHSAIETQPINFTEIVHDLLLVEKKKGLPERFMIKTHIQDDIEFYSDKEFVRIILENLIANAIKFYNDSGRVDPFVDISISKEKHNVVIKVIDNGIGIKHVDPEKIFQMFSRGSERSQTGGIGLYITKTAVQKLGGSIVLSSTSDGYTEFVVHLPLVGAKVMV